MMPESDVVAAHAIEERLAALRPQIEAALTRSVDALTDLGSLVKMDESLRLVLTLFPGGLPDDELSRAADPRMLSERVERAARMVRTARHDFTNPQLRMPFPPERTVEERPGPTREAPEVQSPAEQQSTDIDRSEDENATQLDRARTPKFEVAEVAGQMAQQTNGVVRVADLARRMMQIDPRRYANLRSAYSSAYQQLDQSAEFTRGDRGAFVRAPATRARDATTEPDRPDEVGQDRPPQEPAIHHQEGGAE